VTSRRLLGAALALAVAVPAGAVAAPDDRSVPARLQPWLAQQLADAPSATHRVFVHATRTTVAERAVAAAGLRVVERFDAVDVVVADGPAAAVRELLDEPGVTYVEGDLPVRPLLDRVHVATRNAEAQATVTTAGSRRLGGHGVSVAVIDTGVDGTHPFFELPEGGSRVVVNLKSVCHSAVAVLVPETGSLDQCWVPVLSNDSDTASTAGHGTHVAGIASGGRAEVRSTLLGDERTLTGVAPDSRVVALAVGQSSSVYGAYSALHWLVKHHRQPCGAGVDPGACPPVRVVNNSYGPVGGSRFDPLGVVAQLNRRLVAEGVTVVYAAGNDAGDGSGKDLTGQRAQGTNGPGNDPTPGVLMVASYDDRRTGTRDGQVSSFSSRGTRGVHETYPDLSAPGSSVTSSCRQWMPTCADSLDTYDGRGAADVAAYATLSGTSMAAPYVAGVVAELLQVDPRLSPAQVEAALEDSAHRFAAGAPYEADPSNPGSPTSFDKGHGLVDVVAAVERVRAGVRPLPTPPGTAAGPATPGARPAAPTYVLPKGQTSCRGAFVDHRGDADDLFTQADAAPNRPSLDLLRGRWEWDGTHLTAVIVVDDLASATRSLAAGEHFGWDVEPAGGDPFTVVVSLASGGSYLSRPGAQNVGRTVSVDATTVDRPGSGDDEVRAAFSDEELQQLPGRSPALARGLALTTARVDSSHQVGFAPLQADVAEGTGCPYRVGAADRLR
jgi:subtilisin family serine protease